MASDTLGDSSEQDGSGAAGSRVEEPSGEHREEIKKSGTVALVGRPNAGKSTLMNHLLQEKLAIVSDKPQTTRHRLMGILTAEPGQMVFFDTPGIHKPLHRLNRGMVRHAADALRDADVVCLLVDCSQKPGSGDQYLLDLVTQAEGKKVLALNKIDRVAKASLLPRIARYGEADCFTDIVPISALKGDGCEELMKVLWQQLPVGEALYDPELLTLHPERFLAAERIREKVLELTRDELPFTTAVVIDRWEEEGGLVRIYATILAERPGQKKILIGKGGSVIKAIGTAARHDLEPFLERRLYLDLQVKLEPAWRENRRVLRDIDQSLNPQIL